MIVKHTLLRPTPLKISSKNYYKFAHFFVNYTNPFKNKYLKPDQNRIMV